MRRRLTIPPRASRAVVPYDQLAAWLERAAQRAEAAGREAVVLSVPMVRAMADVARERAQREEPAR